VVDEERGLHGIPLLERHARAAELGFERAAPHIIDGIARHFLGGSAMRRRRAASVTR